jgi:hypothetical protein
VRSESAMGRGPFLFFWFGMKCTVTVLNWVLLISEEFINVFFVKIEWLSLLILIW